jgi:hypothetical protein
MLKLDERRLIKYVLPPRPGTSEEFSACFYTNAVTIDKLREELQMLPNVPSAFVIYVDVGNNGVENILLDETQFTELPFIKPQSALTPALTVTITPRAVSVGESRVVHGHSAAETQPTFVVRGPFGPLYL